VAVIKRAPVQNADLLRSIPLFEGLTEDDLLVLAGSVTSRPFKAGQLIFNQGDPGSEMFIVADGHVNIHLPGDASRRVSLKDISRGEYFGELALFDDKPRSASALATTDAVLLELTRATLSGYLAQRPRAAMNIRKERHPRFSLACCLCSMVEIKRRAVRQCALCIAEYIAI